MTQEQQEIAYQLLKRNFNLASDAYCGCIHAITQKEYPDRVVHFAHSLREVIELLAKKSMPESDIDKWPRGKKRLECLMHTFDPKGKNRNREECKELDNEYRKLSKIAHHCEHTHDEDSLSPDKRLSHVNGILSDLLEPQTRVDHNSPTNGIDTTPERRT